MNGVSGSTVPAVLWAQIMRDAHRDQVAVPLLGVPAGPDSEVAPEGELESVGNPADRLR
jgi:hypothetical protein